MFERV